MTTLHAAFRWALIWWSLLRKLLCYFHFHEEWRTLHVLSIVNVVVIIFIVSINITITSLRHRRHRRIFPLAYRHSPSVALRTSWSQSGASSP